MPIAKAVNAQRDFSGGEADVWLKRADDHPALKSTARQMSNWRPLSSRAISNRPGRSLLALEGPRVDQVVMSPGNTFYLSFGNSTLRVLNSSFLAVFGSNGPFPWTTATTSGIVWDTYKLSIYICFDGMQPLVLTWDGASSWSLVSYAEDVRGGQKRTPFYRISTQGITMLPSASGATGSITLTFSSPICVPGMVGTRMRYITSQLLITAYIDTTHLQATIQETVHAANQLIFAPGVNILTFFNVGDEVIGQTSGATGLVVAAENATPSITVQRFTAVDFAPPEVVVGPNGSFAISSRTDINPLAVTIWDDEVMNSYRGWPRSCFVDQGRLGFCDFPSLPGFMAWSAVGTFTDQYTDKNNAGAANAIQELVPSKSRVYYVLAGAEGSEFVFCDNAVYYIPINQTTPLQPGSVAFNTLMSEGILQVKPRPVQQSIVFVSAGGTQIKAVQAIGAYNRPYIVDDISELHSHLLKDPIAIAAPAGSDQFEESYFYIANSDGSIVLCNYNVAAGIIDTKTLGWFPWTGSGTATWISSFKGHSDVMICSVYSGVAVLEKVDANQYIDCAALFNSYYIGDEYPNGKGRLWWLPGRAVDLMDGLRMMGTYQIDANGFLVPQNNAGEDLGSATLTFGFAWTATLEPFIPAVQPGQDVNQRLRKRRIQRFETYVQNSSGFTICRLFGGPITQSSPAVGTIMQRRRIPAWNQDDDPTQPPPLREQSYSARPLGRLHDPRVAIIKDTPGPLTILEVDIEVSV